MADQMIEVDEIPEKGITVTTVVVDGVIETAVHQMGAALAADGQPEPAGIATIQRPVAEGSPLLQHDLVVRDVHAGVYGDFSEEAAQKDAS